jgi:hypothetical protein
MSYVIPPFNLSLTHTHTYTQFPIQFTTCDLSNAESGGEFYAKFADDTTTTLAFSLTEGGVNSQTLFMQDAQSQDVTLCAQSSDAWCLESLAMTGVDLGIATTWLDNPCSSSSTYATGTCATCLAVSFVAPTATPSVTPSAAPLEGCPEGWNQGPTDCYQTQPSSIDSWTECSSTCAGLDASMLCTRNQAEHTYTTSLLYTDGNAYLWTGLSRDNNQSPFHWQAGCDSTYESTSGYQWIHESFPQSTYGWDYVMQMGYGYDGKYYNIYDAYSYTICVCQLFQ